MRNHYNHEKLEAAKILDLVKAGGFVSKQSIRWALWTLGDLVGFRD